MDPKVVQKRKLGLPEPSWTQQAVPRGPRRALGGACRASLVIPRPFLALKLIRVMTVMIRKGPKKGPNIFVKNSMWVPGASLVAGPRRRRWADDDDDDDDDDEEELWYRAPQEV